MSFLTPLFLLGLAGLAIPVVIHLIQRERKNVVEFPSLMFLRRIPYQSVRRRRIRHWLLLAMRLAALALIVAAFARPFLRRSDMGAAASGGAREVVVLIDRSYSMAYADRWQRALALARDAVNQIGPGDRGSVVFFASGAEVTIRSASDRARLLAAVASGKPGAGATRYGPALKLAGSILSESPLPRREVVLITDFQRSGWQGADGVRLPDGATVTPFSVGDEDISNVAVAPVSLQRSTFSDQERVTVTGGVLNRGNKPVSGLSVTLELNGRALQTEHVNVAPHGSASVTFAPFTAEAANTRGTIRIGADALEIDNAFHFVVSPKTPVKLVIAERSGGRQSSLYLSRAVALGDTPPLQVTVKSAELLSAEDIQNAGVIVLNDVPVQTATAERLGRFVERGGGLLFVAGERAAWPAGGPDVLPGVLGPAVDRSKGDAARLGALEYGHPVFEPFRAPRSGNFSGARFYGYRAVTAANAAQTLARFDDGAPALLERRVGNGRTLLWASSIDLLWNDLALKPVFLPFVHRMARHLASYSDRAPWVTVGEVLEPPRATTTPARQSRVALAPSGQRIMLDDGEGPEVLELSEQGFYEVRAQGRDSDAPMTIASNVDLSESDLTPIDPAEVVAAATGHAGGPASATFGVAPTDEAQERAQRIWWYLLFAGLIVLAAESILAGRLSLRT